MNDDAKILITGIICGAMIAISLIIGINVEDYKEKKTALENNYEQVSVKGYDFPVWQKVKWVENK